MSVRVRLAPSPTGPEPHVGNIRTAIFDWLLRQHEGGQFVVRVEDTDRNRYVPGAVEAMLEALHWLGLDPDEGPGIGGPFAPYVESERLPLYLAAVEQLLAGRHAYRCYCTPERLDEMRRAQQEAKQPPRYDRRCRFLSPEDRRAREEAGETWVVRFAVPLEGETRVHDLIRGEIIFTNASQDDFIILKTDGYPTYHLASSVDDHAMEISHVLRGEEWLPSFPKHVMVYEALGYELPQFAHLPLILGTDRKKLSKRQGDTAVSAFRRQGYLPEALFNFLGLLGWSLDDKTEIISREEFIANFSLDRVNKSPAIFDLDKLTWMNGVYIRMLPEDVLARHVVEWLERELPAEVPRPLDLDYVGRLVPLIRERIKLLSEVVGLVDFFFVAGSLDYPTPLLLGKRLAGEPRVALDALRATFEALSEADSWSTSELERVIAALPERLELKKGDLYSLIRVAVTGKTVTPPLFESMEVLGRERTLDRLKQAMEKLAAPSRRA